MQTAVIDESFSFFSVLRSFDSPKSHAHVYAHTFLDTLTGVFGFLPARGLIFKIYKLVY